MGTRTQRAQGRTPQQAPAVQRCVDYLFDILCMRHVAGCGTLRFICQCTSCRHKFSVCVSQTLNLPYLPILACNSSVNNNVQLPGGAVLLTVANGACPSGMVPLDATLSGPSHSPRLCVSVVSLIVHASRAIVQVDL